MTSAKEIRKHEADRRRRRLAELIRLHFEDTQKVFIDRTGINQGELSSLLRDKSFGSVKARSLEQLVGALIGSLDQADGQPFYTPNGNHISAPADLLEKHQKPGMFDEPSLTSDGNIGKNDTTPGPLIRGQVPLISWDQVRTWDLLMQTFDIEDAEGALDCPAPHSKLSFCVKNNTDAMDDGSAEGYRAGEILFVDPAAAAVPGKDVIVIAPGGHVMFRRLKEDMEGQYLLALNGRKIERLPDGAVFRGVVIFSGVFR